MGFLLQWLETDRNRMVQNLDEKGGCYMVWVFIYLEDYSGVISNSLQVHDDFWVSNVGKFSKVKYDIHYLE